MLHAFRGSEDREVSLAKTSTRADQVDCRIADSPIGRSCDKSQAPAKPHCYDFCTKSYLGCVTNFPSISVHPITLTTLPYLAPSGSKVRKPFQDSSAIENSFY